MDKNFRITITKVVPNPKFAEEVEAMEKDRRYNQGMYRDRETMPMREVTTDVLITELTEEQFEKVRKEVLAVF